MRPGDTLSKIAAKFLGGASKYPVLMEANGIADPNRISVGQVLTIPAPPAEPEAPPKPRDPRTPLSEGEMARIIPGAGGANLRLYLKPMNDSMAAYQVDSPLRQSHFIAQVAHESGSFRYNEENLNYSAKALRAVFGKYFPDQDTADRYARQPEKIANRVYADRMGNGSEQSGDGWAFRGRGLIQLTGKNNYTAYGRHLGKDLVAQPDLVAGPELAVDAAGWYWTERNLNKWADLDDIKKITRLINGGLNGLKDREEFLERAKTVLI